MKDDFKQQIDKLRQVYTSPEDLVKIKEWEAAWLKAFRTSELKEHYLIKDLLERISKQTETIDFKLLNDRKLSPEDRRDLFTAKDIFSWFNSLFAVEARMKSIETEVKDNLCTN